jgi:hypothetical protein
MIACNTIGLGHLAESSAPGIGHQAEWTAMVNKAYITVTQNTGFKADAKPGL